MDGQAYPIIADEQLRSMRVPPQTDDHFCGPAMLDRVVERFLSQPKKMVGHCLVANHQINLSFDTARDAEEFFQRSGQLCERFDQAVRLQFDREKSARQIPRLRQSLKDEMPNFCRIGRFRQAPGG